MNLLHAGFFRLREFFRGAQLDRDMAEEMRAHLAMETERNIARGLPPDDARHAAQRQFGHLDGIQETARDERGWVWLELRWKELQFAVRSLRRAPGFSLAVLITLALCIGPNAAILSVLHALVLKPLPVHDPDRLVTIYHVAQKGGGTKMQASVAQYLDFKARADRFEGFAFFSGFNSTIGEESTPVRSAGLQVSSDFFALLGLQPRLGRFFSPEEQAVGKDHEIVLTLGTWEKRFNADPGVIGREIRMNGEPYTIVGVAPQGFEDFFTTLDFFKPYPVGPEESNPLARYWGRVSLLGRLKPGATLAAGRTQLEVMEHAYYNGPATPQQRSYLDAGGYRIAAGRVRDELSEPVETPLLLLQGGAAFVLLLGCVNVASLLLARANAKRSEMAVRQALGAGRATLLRQMLAESLLLVGVAAAAGIGLAFGALRIINHYLPLIARNVPPVTLDAHVIALLLPVIAAIILAMGFVPFFWLWRSDLRVGETPTASAGRRSRALLGSLVIGQVAIALVLLVGAGLLIHSFARVMAVNPGFDAARVVGGRIALPLVRYKDPKDNVAVQQRILAGMKAIPGVETACLVGDYAISPSFRLGPFLLRGSETAAGQGQPMIFLNVVSPEFFATMGIRLLDGRPFRDDDVVTKDPVVIVDQTFAERYFPGRSVVGQEIVGGTTPPPAGKPWARIAGVVARANLTGLEGRDSWPFVYVPINQTPMAGFSVLLRTSRPEADVIAGMRAQLRTIDSTLPLYSTGSVARGLDDMLAKRRSLTSLLGLFAGLALILAAVGLYGVLNYDVSQRTREIGIRGAIGATRAQIVSLILGQGMRKTVLGLVAGLAGAVFLTRFLRKLLFEITPADPAAYLAVTVLLLLVALLASWLPARRAAKVDPVIALRTE